MTTGSFKGKRFADRPVEEWITVENTHEALVDHEIFDTVQARLNVKQPLKWVGTSNKFRGLMICEGCQTRMLPDSRKRRSCAHPIPYQLRNITRELLTLYLIGAVRPLNGNQFLQEIDRVLAASVPA